MYIVFLLKIKVRISLQVCFYSNKNSLDSYLNPDGSSNQELTFFTSATPGAIYTIVKTADNNAFPLRAKIENLSMEEGGIIADLYVEILKDGKVLDKSISDALIEDQTLAMDKGYVFLG